MKKSLIITQIALTGILGADPADDYVNWIRQTQADTGVEWDVTVASTGASLSEEGVGAEGSFFQLWSIHSATTTEYLLDEQYVSSYLPTGRITILTGDPYTSIKRTRVDQPFSITVTAAGLDDGTSGLPPADIPEAAKKIGFEHIVRNYDEATHELPTGIDNLIEIGDSFVDDNGDTVFFYNLSSLTGADLTQVEGEEVFTVTSLEDFGTGVSILDSQRLQVWPIASGVISGINTVIRYTKIPTIFVELTDLYPKSETYVRAYHGPPVDSPVDPFLLPASYVKIADAIPQSRDLVVKDVDELFEREGPYTVELIHETPFGYDILHRIHPLRVDRTIEVNMNLYSGD